MLVVALFAIAPVLFTLAEWLLSWTERGDGDWLQVIFTMGIFPIIMNVLQFWLIDSIVKASSSAVALAIDASEDQDREPLFTGGSDDEDDDSDIPQPHDLESQSQFSRATSITGDGKVNGGMSTLEEPKTADSTESYTPGTSSSSTSHPIATHAYPPSINSVSSSPQSSIAPSIRKYKRAPPPPLSLRVQNEPVINSPQVSAAPQPTTPLPPAQPVIQIRGNTDGNKDWESWEDSDDWANRVGEEEWTGRRMDEKKNDLANAWDTPSIQVGV